MSSKEINPTDLTRPQFTRGALAAAERGVIEHEFSSYVNEVLGMVNDGKEATVYLCRVRPGVTDADFVAAKMYRARKFRAFANESTYINPEKMRDRRMRKAIQKRTRRGRDAAHHHWIEREWDALETLHAAGASVPRPYARCGDGILMEYLGHGETRAPALIELALSREEAQRVLPLVIR
ncbi:MAG TPA: RIO1 family regulatory kinase/ATPase, partial [Pseudomonadales bacterium]